MALASYPYSCGLRASVHHKKVERLGHEEGLQVPGCHRPRKRLHDHQHSIIRMRPLYPNPICSVDFVQDRLIGDAATGCSPSWMSTHVSAGRCLHRFSGLPRRLETLSACFIRYGKPEYIRSDNGSEFKARRLQEGLREVHVKPIYIHPGSPWENGYHERFNGTLT